MLVNLLCLVIGKKGIDVFEISASLRVISLHSAKELCNIGYHVIPGQKLCPKCRLSAPKQNEKFEESNDTEEADDLVSYEEDFQLDSNREILNTTLNELDISPVKVHSVSAHSKLIIGKRKLKQVGVITKKIAVGTNVDEESKKENK